MDPEGPGRAKFVEDEAVLELARQIVEMQEKAELPPMRYVARQSSEMSALRPLRPPQVFQSQTDHYARLLIPRATGSGVSLLTNTLPRISLGPQSPGVQRARLPLSFPPSMRARLVALSVLPAVFWGPGRANRIGILYLRKQLLWQRNSRRSGVCTLRIAASLLCSSARKCAHRRSALRRYVARVNRS